MADNHSGGDTGRPRHAEPWWMDEPDSMEDTHSFRRDELHGDPRELRRARHAAPRRGLSDSAIHTDEESEPTRHVDRPGSGATQNRPEADFPPPTSERGSSDPFSRTRSSDSGTRSHLASSASDAARIRRAASEDYDDLPLTRSATTGGSTTGPVTGARRSADSPDEDPDAIYRRPSSASHPISRTGTARHSANTPDSDAPVTSARRTTSEPAVPGEDDGKKEAPDAQTRSAAPAEKKDTGHRSRRRRPGTAAAASVAGITAATASSATPVDNPAAEAVALNTRSANAATGRGSRRGKGRRGEQKETFREGRYSLQEDGAEEQELRSEPDRPRSTAFRKASLWTVLGAMVPGLGLVHSRVHRRRRLGLVLIGLVLIAITVITIEAVTNPAAVASIAVRPRLLRLISWTLPVGALALVGLLVFTHIDIRPRKITRTQRWISSLLVGTLSLLIAAPLTVGSRYASDEAAALSKIFKDRRSGTRPSIDTNKSVSDIWKDKKRVNILLVGADDSGQRNYRKQGEMNTDTMMVASINTQTGNTSIIQIPRNTANIPFPKDSKLHQIYPEGFSNGHGDDANFFANALWTTVENEHKDAMGETDYPGADALKLGIGEALGLKLDYFMMLDIDGLQKFITAIGGVTVNVNERLPIAGNTEGKEPTGYIEVGPNQHLTGYNAMWYARSRSASTDYDRMGRQSCLIKAVLDQVSPQVVLTKFEAIAGASGDMMVSDVPEQMLPAFVELALRVRGGNINRLLFTQGRNGFQPYDPDYDLIRKQVKQTITSSGNEANKNKPVTSASPKSSSKASKTASSKPSATGPATTAPTSSSPSASSSAVSQSVTDVCGYHPVQQQR